MVVHEMTRQESIAILSSRRLAPLACIKDNQPYLVPCHYAFLDNHLYSFALSGQIDWMRENVHVCVQVNQLGANRQWRSVVVYGLFEELPPRNGSASASMPGHCLNSTPTGGSLEASNFHPLRTKPDRR